MSSSSWASVAGAGAVDPWESYLSQACTGAFPRHPPSTDQLRRIETFYPNCRVVWKIAQRMLMYIVKDPSGSADILVWEPPTSQELANTALLRRRLAERIGAQKAAAAAAAVLPAAAAASSGCAAAPSSTATVHSDYLTTLAQSHSDFLFGAFGELIHNSVDAGATHIDISLIRPNVQGRWPSNTICIKDNGRGMGSAQLDAMLRFGKKQQSSASSASAAGCYGIGFKSGVSRLCRYATVLTRESGSAEFLVALLNPKCQDADGNLEVPTVNIDPDTPGKCPSPNPKIQARWQQNATSIEKNTLVPPLRWVIDNASMLHGTALYLQGLHGESSDADVKLGNGTTEWIVDENKHDIVHGQGSSFRRMRDAQQLADRIDIDWSFRSYLEAMYADLPARRVTITLLGEPVDLTPIVKRVKDFDKQDTYRIPNPQRAAGGVEPGHAELVIGFSREALTRGLSGVHIYWRDILIESYVFCHYDPRKNEDHGYIGVLRLHDNSELTPLNHKQGFPRSSPQYAALKKQLAETWRRHVAAKINEQRVEDQAGKRARANVVLASVEQRLKACVDEDCAECCIERLRCWSEFTSIQLRIWVDTYDDDDVQSLIAQEGLTRQDLAVRFSKIAGLQRPKTVEEVEKYIKQYCSQYSVQCAKCNINRVVDEAVHAKWTESGKEFTCAALPRLRCATERDVDKAAAAAPVLSEQFEGVQLVGDRESDASSGDATLASAALSLLRVDRRDFTCAKSRPLGQGHFSSVFLGRWQNVDVAIKLLKTGSEEEDAATTAAAAAAPLDPVKRADQVRLLKDFLGEVSVLARLQHPLLVRMLFFCDEARAIGFEYLSEYVQLDHILPIGMRPKAAAAEDAPPLLQLEHKLALLCDVARALAYLHGPRLQLLHRDLSPANILVNPRTWSVKLIDFGLSVSTHRQQHVQKSGPPDMGAAAYKAPERWAHSDSFERASDMFSFAIVMFEVLVDGAAWVRPAGARVDYEWVRKEITEGRRPDLARLPPQCPLKIKELLSACWGQIGSKRPSALQAVQQLESTLHSVLHGFEGFKRRHSFGLPQGVAHKPQQSLVYRVLHERDIQRIRKQHLSKTPINIVASDPASTLDLVKHVSHGSKRNAPPSPFISTTLRFPWALWYSCKSFLANPGPAPRPVIVALDLAKLRPDEWECVYDLTSEALVKEHGLVNMSANWAVDAQEVLFKCTLRAETIVEWYRMPRAVGQATVAAEPGTGSAATHMHAAGAGGVAPAPGLQLPPLLASKGSKLQFAGWLNKFSRMYPDGESQSTQQRLMLSTMEECIRDTGAGGAANPAAAASTSASVQRPPAPMTVDPTASTMVTAAARPPVARAPPAPAAAAAKPKKGTKRIVESDSSDDDDSSDDELLILPNSKIKDNNRSKKSEQQPVKKTRMDAAATPAPKPPSTSAAAAAVSKPTVSKGASAAIPRK